MTASWRAAPPPVVSLVGDVADLVAAAFRADAAGVADATGHVLRHDGEQVRDVMGRCVRVLLEQTHLDGLSGDDIARVLDGCLQRSADWFPDADPGVVVIILTGALGIFDPEEDEPDPPSPAQLARHAALVAADLLAEGGQDLTALDAVLDRAVEEIRIAAAD